MKKYSSILFLFLFSIYHQSHAQVAAQDSTFLVQLYDNAGGTSWVNNNNWKSNQPVSTWFGVKVVNARVRAVQLPGNHLVGNIPGSINDLTDLDTFRIDGNQIIDFPAMMPNNFPNIKLVDVRHNELTFEDLEPNLALINDDDVDFLFAPQDSIGMSNVFNRGVGHEHEFLFPMGGTQNQYQWFKDGTAIVGATDSNLVLNNLALIDTGFYHLQITSTIQAFNNFAINSFQQELNVEWCKDSLGGLYICDEMIVEFEPNTSSTVKDSLRTAFGAVVTDSCMCAVIEVWDLLDTVTLEGEDGRVVAAQEKPEIEDAGLNYAMFLKNDTLIASTPPSQMIDGNDSNDPNKVTVALIDSGIDYDHPNLEEHIWINPGENASDAMDNDGNCLVDDYMGYDFYEEDILPYDNNGHGTHVAGIITNTLTKHEVELINLKFTDKNGQGSLFDAACAVYYAIDKDADLINASWGYVGNPSPILYRALEKAGENCGMLVFTSAGNDALDIDRKSNTHYPSNYNLDNIISVANFQPSISNLHALSNFGQDNCDLAAPGVTIYSTLPNNVHGWRTGTSMAAAKVCNTAAEMLYDEPAASFRGLKHCLLDGVTIHAALSSKTFTSGNLNAVNAKSCIISSPFATECDPVLSIKMFLEGAYDTGTGKMYDSLRTNSLIPVHQPFNVPPWNYMGSDTVSAAVLAVSDTNAVVDWILVRYFDPIDSTQLTIPALVQRDGDVVNGEGNLLKLGSILNKGFISIVHRNHLGVSSRSPQELRFLPTIIDFSNPSFQTRGLHSQKNIGGVLALWGGDANADGKVNVVDKNLYWLPQLGSAPSYNNTGDFNLDVNVNTVDINNIWKANNSKESKCLNCY